MASWDGEHGIFGKVSEDGAALALRELGGMPGFDGLMDAPVERGAARAAITFEDEGLTAEGLVPAAVMRLTVAEGGEEVTVAYAAAPMTDPDTGSTWDGRQAARLAYDEVRDALEFRGL